MEIYLFIYLIRVMMAIKNQTENFNGLTYWNIISQSWNDPLRVLLFGCGLSHSVSGTRVSSILKPHHPLAPNKRRERE